MNVVDLLYSVIGIIGELALDKGQVTSYAEPGTVRLYDSSKSWKADIFRGCSVAIVYGPGTGQKVRILSNGADYLVVAPPLKFGVSPLSMYVILQEEAFIDVDALIARLNEQKGELLDEGGLLGELPRIEEKLDTWLKFWLGQLWDVKFASMFLSPLEDPVVLASGGGKWETGSFSDDLIAAGQINSAFVLSSIDVGSPDVNGDYTISVYCNDEPVATVGFQCAGPLLSSVLRPLSTSVLPAGSRVRSKLMHSVGGASCTMKVYYQEVRL